MKILCVVYNYPHAGHSFSGIFNERSVLALRDHCQVLEVLTPHPYFPYLPSSISPVPRWNSYANAAGYEERNGTSVYRPACLQLPRIGTSFWQDRGAFLFSKRTALKMHRRVGFDAIMSFDLVGVGGLAWRLGEELGIPATGWAAGSDVRNPGNSALGRLVCRAIKHLDLVFYQSHELLETASKLVKVSPELMDREKHIVLPRGIPEPPSLPRMEMRHQIRSTLGITNQQIAVLYTGRISRAKGMVELLEAISLAAAKNPKVTCVIVGSNPAFDETSVVLKKLDEIPRLKEHVKLLPACNPERIWEYLCAADIFAFPSHNEGMPNSLLEAMVMSVPAIAFAIPPVLEIEARMGALVTVPLLNSELFAEAILHLASSADIRISIAEKGRAQVLERFMVRKNMAKAYQLVVQIVEKRKSSTTQVGRF